MMNLNVELSKEMIEKVVCVSSGRVREMNRLIVMESNKEARTEREEMRKKIILNDFNKSLKDAQEVYELFHSLSRKRK